MSWTPTGLLPELGVRVDYLANEVVEALQAFISLGGHKVPLPDRREIDWPDLERPGIEAVRDDLIPIVEGIRVKRQSLDSKQYWLGCRIIAATLAAKGSERLLRRAADVDRIEVVREILAYELELLVLKLLREEFLNQAQGDSENGSPSRDRQE